MSVNVVHLLPPMPDLGPPTAVPNPEDPGSYLLNVAMTVRIARHEPTPQSAAFYRAFCRHWNQVRFGPGTVDQRQAMALQRACDEVGFTRMAGGRPS